MWHVLHLIARPFEALLGVFCVVTAIMLYPGEEGKIQSKFEDFWVRVDDFQNLALSRHATFMTQVARLETQFLDRSFGHKLFSGQSVALSCWFSAMSFGLAGTYLKTFTHYAVLISPLIVGPVVGLSFVCLGFIVYSGHRMIRDVLSVLGYAFIVVTVLNAIQVSNPLALEGFTIIYAALFAGGFFCDVLFIAITRKLMKRAGDMKKSRAVIGSLLANLVLAAFLVGPAFFWSGRRVFPLLQKNMILAISIPTISMSNMFDAVFALLFGFLASMLLLHRLLWPFLTRTLFRMTDIGTKGRRSILVAIGVALLSASVFGGKFPELLKDLVKAFGG
jgi:hypothetical protein